MVGLTKVLGCHSNNYITLHDMLKVRQHSSDNRHYVRHHIAVRFALAILLIFEEEICCVLNGLWSRQSGMKLQARFRY